MTSALTNCLEISKKTSALTNYLEISKKNFSMLGFENVFSDISYSRGDTSQSDMIGEIESLCTGREIIYAPVDQPKSFVSDVKPAAGRVMDFNKGTNNASLITNSFHRYYHPWLRLPGWNHHRSGLKGINGFLHK